MKVLITNAVLSNAGDAAICAGIRQALLDHGYCRMDDIAVIDANSTVTSKIYPNWNVHQQLCYATPGTNRIWNKTVQVAKIVGVRFLTKLATQTPAIVRKLGMIRGGYFSTIQLYADADIVISSGGTYLVDHYDFRPRQYELEFAYSLGAKIALWTQSMGPFLTPRSVRSAQAIKLLSTVAFFRDSPSMMNWDGVPGANIPGKVIADAAFALQAPQVEESRAALKEKDKVLLSVREWALTSTGSKLDYTGYISSFRSAAVASVGLGMHPFALSTCQGVDGYRIDDSQTAEKIFNGLGIDIDRQPHTPDELMEEILASSVVISTRMHLAILAVICRVPVIAVAYEFKTLELFARLQMAENVCAIEDLTEEWLVGRLKEARDKPESFVVDRCVLEELRNECLSAVHDLSLTDE